MKKNIIYALILIVIALFCFTTYKIINKNYINQIYNSLVYIECSDDNSINSGSGFAYKIENNKNYIVTNYHVISGYFDIYVYNINKERVRARLINYDEDNDIAILEIDDVLKLKKVNIDENSYIKKKSKVYAASFPLGIDNPTITSGNIIGLKEAGYDFELIELSLKTDFGSSGGALLNSNGKVVGMIALKDNNSSFAIPISFVMQTIEQLEKKSSNNISLGAVFTNTTNTDLLKENDINIEDIKGVVLVKLDENGTLFKNGFKKGDVITYFNNIEINNVEDLKRELYKRNKGDIIIIGYYRDNDYNYINIEL